MFSNTMTIPPQYGVVEKVNKDCNYDNSLFENRENTSFKILKEIINYRFKYSMMNNESKNPNLLYNNRRFIKTFSKIIDSNNNKKIVLLNPIDFIVYANEEGIYYSNKQLNIFAFGDNQEEAEKYVYDELLFLYDTYALENDEKLDSNAKELKTKLLSIMNINA